MRIRVEVNDEEAQSLSTLWDAHDPIKHIINVEKPGFGKPNIIEFDRKRMHELIELLGYAVALGAAVSKVPDKIRKTIHDVCEEERVAGKIVVSLDKRASDDLKDYVGKTAKEIQDKGFLLWASQVIPDRAICSRSDWGEYEFEWTEF